MKINFSGVISVDIEEFSDVSPRESFEAYMDFLERIGKVVAELATKDTQRACAGAIAFLDAIL